MDNEAIKLELIEWLKKLDDEETIAYLKVVKDSHDKGTDLEELTDNHKKGIDRGLKDVEEGRTTPDETVRKKYDI